MFKAIFYPRKKIVSLELGHKIAILNSKLKNLVKYGTLDFFIAVELETITACNKRCSYCPNSKYDRSLIKNKKLMERELFYKIVNELAKIKFNGRFSVHFYGEPLLDKRLPSLITYVRAKLHFVNIDIYTNGELLTPDLYNKLKKAGVNIFNITQHSPKMPDNVKKLFDYRKVHGKDLVRIIYKIPGRDIELYNRGGLIKLKNTKKMKRCRIPSEVLTVDYQGNVILCCNDYFSSVKFGNLSNESLLSIWNKEHYKKIRKELRKGIFRMDICKKCGTLKK